MKNEPVFLRTPARVMAAVALIILAGEMLVMAALLAAQDAIKMHPTLERLVPYLDPVALIAIIFPALYFLVYRPLTRQATLERELASLTERVAAEQRLVESERHFRAVTESATDAIITGSSSGDVVFWNSAAERLFGYRADEIVGKPLSMLMPERFRKPYSEAMARQLSGAGPQVATKATEFVGLRRDGSEFPVELTVSQWESGEGRFFNAIIRDISERKEAEKVIHKLAFYDELTQLPNRRLLNDRLKHAMSASRRSGRHGAVIFLDLDNFKPLNDQYGHGAGDQLLIEVARRITGCLREMDTVARFGGDEFVVVLAELGAMRETSVAQAGMVAEKIRLALSLPYRVTLHPEGASQTTVEHRCTSSIGVVLFLGHEASVEDVIKWADLAMYQAKDAGRNRVQFFDEGG